MQEYCRQRPISISALRRFPRTLGSVVAITGGRDAQLKKGNRAYYSGAHPRQRFFLSEDHDLTALKQQIVSAVREGADFVEFESIGRGSISVLITSNIPMRFEIISRTDEQVTEWEHNPPPIDTHLDIDDCFKHYDA